MKQLCGLDYSIHDSFDGGRQWVNKSYIVNMSVLLNRTIKMLTIRVLEQRDDGCKIITFKSNYVDDTQLCDCTYSWCWGIIRSIKCKVAQAQGCLKEWHVKADGPHFIIIFYCNNM